MMNGKIFAEIAIARPLDKSLTYEVPRQLHSKIKPGIRVEVPLGRRYEIGWVMSLSDRTGLKDSLIRPVRRVIDMEPLFTGQLIDLFRWASEYYMVSPGYFFRAAMPPGLSEGVEFTLKITAAGSEYAETLKEKKRLSINDNILLFLLKKSESDLKTVEGQNFGRGILNRCYRLEEKDFITIDQLLKVREDYLLRKSASILSDKYINDPEAALNLCSRSQPQMKIIKYLSGRSEPVLNSEIIANLNLKAGSLKGLKNKGIVDTVYIEQERERLYPDHQGPYKEMPVLTFKQSGVADRIYEKIKSASFQPFLIRGVTGSGKTEIYLYLCDKVIRFGRSVLVLVPEISLTPQLYRRFQEHFGGRAALLHSGLSTGERFEQWLRIRKSEAVIAIGTRSAVFAPLQNIGLIIVDEEHDGSYKQEDTPKYNGRDLALKRGELSSAPVVLGSATPSVETYYRAVTGEMELLEINERYGSQKLPQVTLIDMRKVYEKAGFQKEISDDLDEKIEGRLNAGEQVLILINRRGYRSRLICRLCGKVLLCDYCNVAMKYHKGYGKMICHFCETRKDTPSKCEKCGGDLIEFAGIGTERIEEILKTDFRTAKIQRMDYDTTRTRGGHYNILEKLRKGEIDILVGTQMIAKGHDYPNITLVGVISAESILALPDFRHSERTFQLLTQVAGRAGRGEQKGEVVMQAFDPDHFSILCARNHDYKSFYEQEILLRRRLGYPPFSSMSVIRFEAKDRAKALKGAHLFKSILDRYKDENDIIKGPKFAPLSRIRDRYRVQLIIRSQSNENLKNLLHKAIADGRKEGVSRSAYIVDIDPYNLM